MWTEFILIQQTSLTSRLTGLRIENNLYFQKYSSEFKKIPNQSHIFVCPVCGKLKEHLSTHEFKRSTNSANQSDVSSDWFATN